MTRIVIILMLLFMAKPALAASAGGYMFHCAGYENRKEGIRTSYAKNFVVATDGSWIKYDGLKIKRKNVHPDGWEFKGYAEGGYSYYLIFGPKSLDLIVSVSGVPNTHRNIDLQLACFPIQSPFANR